MNQSFGGRFYTLNETDFNSVKDVLRKTKITNLSYKTLMGNTDALYFLDPLIFHKLHLIVGFLKTIYANSLTF